MTLPATGIFASDAARSSAFVRCPTASLRDRRTSGPALTTTASIRSPTFSPSSSLRSMSASDLPPIETRTMSGVMPAMMPLTTCPSRSFFLGVAASAARAASKVLRSADSAVSTDRAMRVWGTDRSPGPPSEIPPEKSVQGCGTADSIRSCKMRLVLRTAPPEPRRKPRWRSGGMAEPGVLTATGASPSGAAAMIARLAPSRDELRRWYAPDAPRPAPRRQGAELSQAGPRLVVSRAVRGARRDPGRARRHVPARTRLPLPLLPGPHDVPRRRPLDRGDPAERDVEAGRRRFGRPAHVEPLRASPRSTSRTSRPACRTTPSTPPASAAR